MGKIFYLVPKVKGRRGSMALLPPPPIDLLPGADPGFSVGGGIKNKQRQFRQ